MANSLNELESKINHSYECANHFNDITLAELLQYNIYIYIYIYIYITQHIRVRIRGYEMFIFRKIWRALYS